LLQTLGAAAIGATAGCSFFESDDTPTPVGPDPGTPADRAGPPGTRPSPGSLRDVYSSVVNVVEEGADATGGESVGDVVESAVDDDTLLVFPRGEYRMSEPLDVDSFSKLGLLGDGAVIRPPTGYADYLFGLGSDSDATDLHVEGFEFDFTAPNTGARPIHAAVEDGLFVRDVRVRGQQDVDQDSMRFDVTDPDGTGRVERLRLPDGGSTEYSNTGIYVGEQSSGTLSFVDCEVAGFPDNGLYASPATGPVHVVGGHYANNGVASVRVSTGGRVRNVRVTCDSTREGLENMRGIRLRKGRDVLVEDCRIDMRAVTESDGAITMAEWLQDATIRNTTIRTDADRVPAVLAKPPNDEAAAGVTDTDSVTLQNIRASGTAADEATVSISDRDRCLLDRVCIHQRGANRHGIQLADASGVVLRDTVVDVTGDPLLLENATTRRQQFRTGNVRACG
jgi:hypothetical protein